MTFLLTVAALICVALAVAFFLLFRKLAPESPTLPAGEDWLEHLSPGHYGPMDKLLDRRDYDFLASQPGVSRQMLWQFRARRRSLFRGYLACLRADYGRLCAAIRILMVHSAQDRPDLAQFLVRQRLWFTLGLMSAQFYLALHTLGVGSVDARRLVHALDSMRLELGTLVMAAQPSAA
jgi:hypothetical protein